MLAFSSQRVGAVANRASAREPKQPFRRSRPLVEDFGQQVDRVVHHALLSLHMLAADPATAEMVEIAGDADRLLMTRCDDSVVAAGRGAARLPRSDRSHLRGSCWRPRSFSFRTR